MKGFGNCEDCGWYKIKEGCNVKRDSKQCLLNKIPRNDVFEKKVKEEE